MDQENFSQPSLAQQPSQKNIKPFWPIVLLVLVVALVGVLLWQRDNADQAVDVLQDIVLSTQKILNGGCVKEGERGGEWLLERDKDKKNDVCCKGLIDIDDVNPNSFDGECMLPAVGGIASSFVCTYCGNGTCGTGENKCNCPADCENGITAKIFPASLYNNEEDYQKYQEYQRIRLDFSGEIDKKTVTDETVKICSTSVTTGSGGNKSCHIGNIGLDYGSGAGGPSYTLFILPRFSFTCEACSWSLEINGLRDTNGNSVPFMKFNLDSYVGPFSG